MDIKKIEKRLLELNKEKEKLNDKLHSHYLELVEPHLKNKDFSKAQSEIFDMPESMAKFDLISYIFEVQESSK